MKRYLRLLLAVLMVVAVLCGCKGADDGGEEAGDGYGQTLSGGSEQKAAVLQSAGIAKGEDGASQVVLEFANADGSPLSALPEYTLRTLDKPYRLRLDVAVKGSIQSHSQPILSDEDNAEIVGVYVRDASTEDGKKQVYIQLNSPNPYKIIEDGGKLSVIFESAEADEEEKHFAYVDAYEDFRYGAMPPGTTDMTPTLCDDTNYKVMISKAFDSAEEAKAYADRIQKVFDEESMNNQRSVKTTALKGNALPEHEANELLDEIADIKPILVGNQETSLPAVYLGGRYLCTSPDGKRLFADSGIHDAYSEDTLVVEQLAILDTDNRIQRLSSLTDIYSIEKAMFSPDGQSIGIMAGDGSMATLYHYNLASKKLLNLSESMAGSDDGGEVYSFVFATDDTIYALGRQLYEIKIEGDSCTATNMLEDNISAGEIGYSNGDIYYSVLEYMSEDADSIYKVTQTCERDRIADGNRLSVSPDGSKVALIHSYYAEDSTYHTSIEMLDTKTGDIAEIEGINMLSGNTWSGDSKCFYYGNAGTGSDYPIVLMRYDVEIGEQTELMGILTGEFYCIDENTMYVVINRGFPVTYEINLDSIG